MITEGFKVHKETKGDGIYIEGLVVEKDTSVMVGKDDCVW